MAESQSARRALEAELATARLQQQQQQLQLQQHHHKQPPSTPPHTAARKVAAWAGFTPPPTPTDGLFIPSTPGGGERDAGDGGQPSPNAVAVTVGVGAGVGGASRQRASGHTGGLDATAAASLADNGKPSRALVLRNWRELASRLSLLFRATMAEVWGKPAAVVLSNPTVVILLYLVVLHVLCLWAFRSSCAGEVGGHPAAAAAAVMASSLGGGGMLVPPVVPGVV